MGKINCKQLAFIPVDSLIPHEQVDPMRVAEVAAQMSRDQVFDYPVVVLVGGAFGAELNIIGDGHHRWTAAKTILGLEYLPAVVIGLDDPSVRVRPWREGEIVTHDTVLQAALSRTPLPIKTSRITIDGLEVSACNIALSDLRSVTTSSASASAPPVATEFKTGIR